MSNGHTHRDFIELSGAAVLAAVIRPARSAAQGGGAEDLSRNAFVLECNTLASFGADFEDQDAGRADLAIPCAIYEIRPSNARWAVTTMISITLPLTSKRKLEKVAGAL